MAKGARLKLCGSCLRSGHRMRVCRTAKRCAIKDCNSHHHKLVHDPEYQRKTIQRSVINQEEAEPNHTILTTSSKKLFRIVPVTLYGSNNKKVDTFAFLDGGSAVRMIDSSLIKELDLAGTHKPLHLTWTKQITVSDHESIITSVGIEERTDGVVERFNLCNVRTIEDIGLPSQTMNARELQKKIEHLRGLSLVDFANVKPLIIIGLEHAKLLVGNRQRVGNMGEPVALKTKLGWVVFGRK